MRRYSLLLALLLAGTAAAAQTPKGPEKPNARLFRLKWQDIERATRGYEVALELPSGIKLRGDVLAVESDDLVLDVRKTSNKHAYPKGRAIVPRAEVTRLRVIKTRHTWRIVGTAVGAGAGVAVAIPVTELAGNINGNKALASVLSVAVPTGLGYLLGWAADVNVVEIAVVPDR